MKDGLRWLLHQFMVTYCIVVSGENTTLFQGFEIKNMTSRKLIELLLHL